MKKRVLLLVVGGLLILGILNPQGERTIDSSLVDSFGGSPTNGCVSGAFYLAKDISLVGLARLYIQYHLKTEGQTVVGARWESSGGGLGPTWFAQSPYDGWPPRQSGEDYINDPPQPQSGMVIDIARGATGKASYIMRETFSYPGCYRIDNIIITRIPYNTLPPGATPPPTPPPGEFSTPTPTPTGHPTPTAVPTSPPCSAEPGFDEEECPPPEGYCYSFGPPLPGEGWPIASCEVPEATPTPTPTAPPSCTEGQESIVTIDFAGTEYEFRKIVWCELEFSPMQEWHFVSGAWQNWNQDGYYAGSDSVTVETGETTLYQRITFGSGDVPSGAFAYEVVRRIGAHAEGAASNGVARTDGGYSAAWVPASDGQVRDITPIAVTVGHEYGPSAFTDQGFDVVNNATIELTEVWLGPALGSGIRPWDGEDVTPTPTPTPTPDASEEPSEGPYVPPTPPVGYPSPDPNGEVGPLPSVVPAVADPANFDSVLLNLQSKAPFNYIVQVTEALDGAAGEAVGGAGPAGGTYGCFTLPRWTPEGTVNTEACVPLQDMANDAAPFRPALLAMLVIGVGVGVLRWTMKATGGS